MKNIRIVREKQDNCRFNIESYYFVEYESNIHPLPIYPITLNISSLSPIDVRLLLEEVSSNIRFLIESPSELTDYIKKYEENLPINEICLFHDLRTRYIDILEYNDDYIEDNVMLVGFSILEQNVYLAIRAFSLIGLSKFTEEIIRYCKKSRIPIEIKNHIRWIQLEQSMLASNNIGINDICNGFLLKTLDNNYCNIFLDAFSRIDFQGYLDKTFYDKVINIKGHKIKIRELNQFTKYFSPFWKSEICVKDTSKTVLCLHDELINEQSINNLVYTLKPHLMQYYQLHWFEDFCSHIIKNMNIPSFKLINIHAGRQFNFFQNGNPEDTREIDIVIGVEHEESFKIIAIECKKTLSDNEIKLTNKKIKDKILKSHTNIIDAYIHIGCFNNDVEFDKSIDGTNKKYKQNIIQLQDDPKAIDAPYYAFCITSIQDFVIKMKHVLNDIFKQW